MVNVKIIIPIIIIIIIAAALIIFTSNEETTKNEIEEKWIGSGPFAIDKAQYNVGEKIFLDTDGLKFDDKGTVEFLRPINDTHHKAYIKIPFDGMINNNLIIILNQDFMMYMEYVQWMILQVIG